MMLTHVHGITQPLETLCGCSCRLYVSDMPKPCKMLFMPCNSQTQNILKGYKFASEQFLHFEIIAI